MLYLVITLFSMQLVISQKIDILLAVPEKVKNSVPPPFESTVKLLTILS
jgi:hypothetical protein